jgi:hypothetical protein
MCQSYSAPDAVTAPPIVGVGIAARLTAGPKRGGSPVLDVRRREFITLLGGAAASWPLAARAQQVERARRIGVLMELAADDSQARSNVAALQRGLHRLGWSQGNNLQVDYRWAPTMPCLCGNSPRNWSSYVIVAHSSPVVATLLGQTRIIPIVSRTLLQSSRALPSCSIPRRPLVADRISCAQSMPLPQP